MPLASQCLVNPSSTTFASSSTSSRQPRSSSASAESGSSSSAEDLASPHTPARQLQASALECQQTSTNSSKSTSEAINIHNLMVPPKTKFSIKRDLLHLHPAHSLALPVSTISVAMASSLTLVGSPAPSSPTTPPVNGNKVAPWPLEDHQDDETTLLTDNLNSNNVSGDCAIEIESPSGCTTADQSHQNGSLRPLLPQPLITVTINPLEKDEMTFVPPSPMVESRKRLEEEEDRKLSIGSASSFDEDPDDSNMLGLGDCGIRRVSDISHINELRREISGLSHLASEFYEVKKTSDPDNISLDSIHLRVLSRCAKYAMIESKSDKASRYFVIITTSLTIFGISCGFWYKNFSGFADDSH